MGLFTMFIKIRAHRGQFLNEKADGWDDEGRKDIDNVRWDGPSLQPTFSWTEEGVEHRCSMNKTLQTRVHLKVSKLQLPSTRTILQNFFFEKTIVEIFWGSTGKTKPSRTGPRGVFCKASATNSHVPSFSSSGVFETVISADSVNASTRS